MIEVEQSAQSLSFANRPGLTLCSLVGEGDDIGEPLMIAFMLVVGQKLLERLAQGTFTKENQLIEILRKAKIFIRTKWQQGLGQAFIVRRRFQEQESTAGRG